MSAAVQCFLLKVEDRDTDFVVAQLKSRRNGTDLQSSVLGCSVASGRMHRAEVPVPSGVSLSNVVAAPDDRLYVQLPDRRLDLCCSYCGLIFRSDETDVWSSHSKHWYSNPVTGKEGSSAYAVGSPGAVYECPWLDEDEHCADLLSEFYHQNWRSRRKPLAVVLPDYTHWIVDQKSTIRGSDQFGPGWMITGQAPALTAVPSIDTGTYHGFLQNGVLTPDLENRVYKERG